MKHEISEERYTELLHEIAATPKMNKWRYADHGRSQRVQRLRSVFANGIVVTATVAATVGISMAVVFNGGLHHRSGPVASAPAQPASPPPAVTVRLLDDSYVAGDQRNTNFGNQKSLSMDNQLPDRRIYLKFSVQGLTGRPKNVQLRLYATSSGTGFQVHSVSTNNWSEATLNWNNAPASGNKVGYHSAFNANAWQSYDVTSLVSGNGTYSLMVTGDTRASFASKEAGPALAPQLIVT